MNKRADYSGKRVVTYRLSKDASALTVIFVLLGAALFTFGSYRLLQHRSFVRRARTTTGIVLSVSVVTDRNSQIYRPTVRFFPDGTSLPITFQESQAYFVPYVHGETVNVRYLPSEPHKAEIAQPMLFTDANLVLMAGGLVMAALATIGAIDRKVGYRSPRLVLPPPSARSSW